MAGIAGGASAPKASEPKQALAIQPRPLGELLDAVVGFLCRWVVFQYPEQPLVCALWVLHTWLFRAFDYTPYLWVYAADKRSGKSRLLEVLKLLSPNAELTESGSAAALVRSIDEANPLTILLDEVDCVYSSKKNDTEADSLRKFLNAGYRRGATFLRCVGQGSNQVPTKFPAFCPKALAGIGRDLPDTVQDRSIPIELVRQSREERAERFRDREAREATALIVAELDGLAQQQQLIDALQQARPALPEKLGDRQQDITEPLMAIADLAGGKWPEGARTALIKLYGQEEDASFGAKLLIAILAVFDESGKDRLTTRQLLDGLVEIEDGPWASMFEDALKHDRLQTAAAKLARILKNYKKPDGEKIKPHPIKLDGDTVKGFYRSDFEAAWSHWLPPSKSAVTSVTSVTYEGKKVTPAGEVTATETERRYLTHEGKSQKVTAVTAAQRQGEDEPEMDYLAVRIDLSDDWQAQQACFQRHALDHSKSPFPDMTDSEWLQYEAEFNASKMIYPGDWLWFKDTADFTKFWGRKHFMPTICGGLKDSEDRDRILKYDPIKVDLSCNRRLADGFYYHRTRHVARCCDCQEAEWIAQGFEVENGFPWGDWSLSTAERIVEEERAALQDAERWLSRKLETKQGKAWLQTEQGQAWQAEQKWQPGDWRANFEEQWRKRQQKRNMTPGEFVAEATRLFNATPATD